MIPTLLSEQAPAAVRGPRATRLFRRVCPAAAAFLLVVAAAAFSAPPAFAASISAMGPAADPPHDIQAGVLVVDVRTEGDEPVAGAQVMIAALERGALTNERGQVRFQGIPAGSHQVRVVGLGYGEASTSVTVQADEVTRVRIDLAREAVALAGLVVRGQSGQADAYNRQRTAANIRNVVSSEHVERFPDTNTSDVLRRIPGVAAQDDRGETGLLFLRGLSPGFTSITLDGQRVPSTTREDRATSLSGVPAEMLGSMEVVKAITPDMDADAISGSITLNPRRPTARQIDGRIEGGLHSTAPGATGRAALTYADVFDQTGIVVSADFSRQDRRTEALAYDWTNLGSGDVSESHLDRLRIQSYPIERTRFGASAQLTQRLSPTSSLFVRGFLTRYDTREERHRVTYRLDAGDRISPEEVVGGRVEIEGREYLRERHIYALTAGGDHEVGGARVDYSLGWNQADRREPFRDYYEYRLSGTDMRGVAADRYRPQVEVLNGDPTNPQGFQLRHFDQRTDDMRDGAVTAALNVEVPWSPGVTEGTLRFGTKATRRTKDRDYNERRWGSFPGSFTMADIGAVPNDRRVLGGYDFGSIVDWNAARPWWNENGGIFGFDEDDSREDSDSEDYSAEERILAAYGMTTLRFGDLEVLAGARAEYTSTEYEGKRLVFGADGSWQETLPVAGSNSYLDFFPMLHLRYRLDDDTNLRFAATTAISRPGFLEVAPNEFIEFGDEEITRGNPELDPTRSVNLDLLAERYFPSVGVLSAGLFYKRIDDFVFINRSTIPSGEFQGFELFQPLNGDRATVRGVELNWHQHLNFLPGPLSGLGIFANYSWVDSNSELGAGADRNLPLPEQVPHIVNAALTYDYGGFVGVVSFNQQGAYIRSVGSDALSDEYKATRRQVDISVHQRITPNLRIFAQANNLMDTPYIRYIGSSAFPDSSDYHGRWGSIGLRFNH